MSLIKYGVYIGILIVFAFTFESIIMVMYDLTLQALSGRFGGYLLLVAIFLGLYIITRAFLNRKVHPKASQFCLWFGAAYIGGTLAAYFFATEPIYLTIFPIIFLVGYWTQRQKSQSVRRHIKFKTHHPELIDNHAGICVIRMGAAGFRFLKFFTIHEPFAVPNLLIFLNQNQIEFTFEVRVPKQSQPILGIQTQGRDYQRAYKYCLHQANQLRQFLKSQEVVFQDINDYVGVQQLYYASYFSLEPSSLNPQGIPKIFPQVEITGEGAHLQAGFSEKLITLQSIQLKKPPTPSFYAYLTTLSEACYLQIHARPLNHLEIDAINDQTVEQYRNHIHNLSKHLEENHDFNTASLLLSKIDDFRPKHEGLRPLLDQDAVTRLQQTKLELRRIEIGRKLGLWQIEILFVGEEILGQVLAITLGGMNTIIQPAMLGLVSTRSFLMPCQNHDSRFIQYLFWGNATTINQNSLRDCNPSKFEGAISTEMEGM